MSLPSSKNSAPRFADHRASPPLKNMQLVFSFLGCLRSSNKDICGEANWQSKGGCHYSLSDQFTVLYFVMETKVLSDEAPVIFLQIRNYRNVLSTNNTAQVNTSK